MITLSALKIRVPNSIDLAWFFLVFAFLGLFSGAIHFWHIGNPTITPSGSYLFFPSMILALTFFIRAWRTNTLKLISPWPFISGLFLVFISDILETPYSLYLGPLIRGEIILFALIFLMLGTQRVRTTLPFFSFAAVLTLIFSYSNLAAGELIFSDDLGTFFYRILLLKDNFPNIPFYNPQWNAGLEQRDFFATGAILLYLIASPIFILTNLKLDQFFNLFVLFLGLILPVLSTFIACRLLKFPKLTSYIAVILVLSCSLFWFRWGFKYGTLGFITANSLLPIVIALLIKISEEQQKIGIGKLILFGVVFSLMILWPFAGVVVAPLLLLCVFYCGKNCLKPKLLITCLLLCACNYPWISTYLTHSKLDKFLTMQHQETAKEDSNNIAKTTLSSDERNAALKSHSVRLDKKSFIKYIRDNLTPINPLLIFLLIPGIFLLGRIARNFYLVIFAWLMLLANVIVIFKPQLELDRMYVVLSLLACLPVAQLITNLLEQSSKQNILKKLGLALVFGFLLTGPFCTVRIFKNGSPEQIVYTTPVFSKIQSAIKSQHQKLGGRILFSGCIIHEFENGHLAPLAYLTNVPLIASSHLHNLWWYKQVIPNDFLELGDAGIEQYLDTYNISSIFAHEPTWRKYFSERTDRYRLVTKIQHFWLFERINFSDQYLLKGQAKEISQSINSISLIPETKEVVLKFNHLENLRSNNCDISPYQVQSSINLIKLENCRTKQTTTIFWGDKK